MYDLIIVGAGPAGITASIYAARKQMNFLVITKDIGGQAAWSGDIQNYTGYQIVTGPDLIKKFEDHLKSYNVELLEGTEVTEAKKDGDVFRITTPKTEYFSKTVLIASGKKSRELGIKGENEYKNKGVAYCTTCDGPMFAKKDVAVIGGGNSALDAALQMEKIASKVYLININKTLSGDEIMREKVLKSAKITVLNESHTVEILGEKFVNGLKYLKNSKEDLLKVGGIFVEIGLMPNSSFVKDVEKNEFGEIHINCQAKTSITGMFAAGDVTSVFSKQVVIAAGDGAKAALSAYEYLLKTK